MRAFLASFGYAARGLGRMVLQERNLRFHLCAAVYVCVFSRFYGLGRGQYALLALVIALVLAAELFNSAVERLVDLCQPQYSAAAGLIKDVAAAGVLVACLGAAVCGVLLFWDVAVFGRIFTFFARRPWWLVALASSLVLCGWFVFGLKNAPKSKETHGR